MNEISSKVILVPVDYTERAEYAIEHALVMARYFEYEICLLNVITKKQVDDKVRQEAAEKINKYAEDATEKRGIHIKGMVKEGSIFTTIGKVADDLKASLIIMGIHGKKGLQHLFGSFAYKVICNSTVPVVVVKNPIKQRKIENIVLPLDFSKESAIKVTQAIKYAHYFKSAIRIIGVLDTKSSVVRIKKEALIKTVMDFIKNAGVKVTADVIIEPGEEAHESIINYAEKIDADMIIIVAEREGGFADLFAKNSAEEIIDESEIPVMTVTPKPGEADVTDSKGKIVKTFVDPMGLMKH